MLVAIAIDFLARLALLFIIAVAIPPLLLLLLLFVALLAVEHARAISRGEDEGDVDDWPIS